MLATLRQRNFALLWAGALISLIGDRAMMTALPFYVYEQTGSTLAMAGMFGASYLPAFLFSSVAGVFVDRWDRKRILVLSGGLPGNDERSIGTMARRHANNRCPVPGVCSQNR